MKGVLKIAGIIIGTLLVMLVAAYFVYPYINEEKYQEIVEKVQNAETTQAEADFESPIVFKQAEDSSNIEVVALQELVDSLRTVNERLKQGFEDSLKAIQLQYANLETTPAEPESQSAPQDEEPSKPREEFSERIKSLLNLDEEALAPIANQMTNEQLVRLYEGAGNIQREKLLRSLNPERAAKLMTEIML